jgi:hypothetical protein
LGCRPKLKRRTDIVAHRSARMGGVASSNTSCIPIESSRSKYFNALFGTSRVDLQLVVDQCEVAAPSLRRPPLLRNQLLNDGPSAVDDGFVPSS